MIEPLSFAKRLWRTLSSHPLRAALHLEHRIYGFLARHGLVFTRVALGVVFLWFGVLKLLPTVTPIDALAERTLTMISLHLVSPTLCLHVLALWECIIGLGLSSGFFLRQTLVLLFLQLPETFLPLVLLTHKRWVRFPVFPTFEGRYIVKNIVPVAAGLVVASAVRGGKIIAHPAIAIRAERLQIKVEEMDLRTLEGLSS